MSREQNKSETWGGKSLLQSFNSAEAIVAAEVSGSTEASGEQGSSNEEVSERVKESVLIE